VRILQIYDLPGYTGNKTPGIRKGMTLVHFPRTENETMAHEDGEDEDEESQDEDDEAQHEYGGLINYILDLSLG
jgi:hypothetical protein